MSPLFRRRAPDVAGIAPRRPQPGVLRRERRALLKAREDALRDLGGLLGLLFFPWGGVIVAVVGLVLIILFLLGIGRRAAHPRS